MSYELFGLFVTEKVISTLWLANRNFYASSHCLNVKGSRRSTLDASFWVRNGQPIIKITVTNNSIGCRCDR